MTLSMPNSEEQEEVEQWCKDETCVFARIHRTIRDIGKATHTLYIDIAGPLVTSDDGFTFFW